MAQICAQCPHDASIFLWDIELYLCECCFAQVLKALDTAVEKLSAELEAMEIPNDISVEQIRRVETAPWN